MGSDEKTPRPPRRASSDALHAHHQALTVSAGKRHDALTGAIEALDRALAMAATHREREWSQRAAGALELVREKIRSHVEGVEEPEGLFEEIERFEPRMVPRIAALRRDHHSLTARATALALKLNSVDNPVARALRGEAATLLSDLREHRAAEADLIYEGLWTELGGGD